MTILEALEEATTEAGITTMAFANIQEFQAFMDSFEFNDYPVNVVLPYDSNGQTLNGIRRAVLPLKGWIVTRITSDTNDYRSLAIEPLYLQPMRELAIKFIKRLLEKSIIDPQAGAVRDTIRPEYMFLNTHVFGVSYSIDLPIIQNVC